MAVRVVSLLVLSVTACSVLQAMRKRIGRVLQRGRDQCPAILVPRISVLFINDNAVDE